MNQRLVLLSLLFFLFLQGGLLSVYGQSKKDSVSFNHTLLAGVSPEDSLYVRSNPSSSSNCDYTIKKATLNAYLYLGTTYKYGTTAFTGSVDVQVNAYSSFSGTSGLVDTYWISLDIDENTPEKLYVKDFTVDHSLINRFEVIVSNYSSSALVQDSIKLAVYYKEEFGIDVSGVSFTNSSTSGSNPVTFSWQVDCSDVPDYEFQLLRLYNTNSAKTTESDIDATVNWDQALTIETLSSDTFLTLTLTEGTGYYIWRVRPIGTEYDGSIADSRNWGSWNNNRSDGSYSFSSAPSDGLFYTQFDDTLNWIYSRTFSEGDPVSPKVRVSEKMTYANGLQQVKQNQAYLKSESRMLINQTVLDYSGRPALNTLPAPVDTTKFGYRTGFIRVGSTLYTAQHFDEDNNYDSPQAITAGPLVDYYSNSNSDQYIANAEGYPYSRALYERDGTNRVREQGAPGETHRIKTSNKRTNRTYYSGVSDQELIRIFGDEAPESKSVHKVLNVDGNETASISYMSKEGQVIASCLSIGTDNTILDTLDSQANSRFTVSDTVRGNTLIGNYGIKSSKPLAFATPTTVTVDYKISAKEIEHLCMNYCNTCDYTFEFIVRGDTVMKTVSKLIGASSCGSASQWDTTFTVPNLPVGSYVFERRVYANNVKTAATDSTVSLTYLQDQLNNLRQRLQDTADAKLSQVYSYLNSSDMSGLYTYLGVNTSVNKPDSVFADSTKSFDIGCANIDIPIQVCQSYDCSDNTPDFEGYFEDRWADDTTIVGTSGGYLKYLNVAPYRFTPGQFNYMVYQMLTVDNGTSPGAYTCSDLWECWDRVTQQYENLKAMSDTMPDYEFNLLTEFLNCTGRKYKGFSNSDTSKYVGKAFEYFYYNTGVAPYCDTLVTNEWGNPNTWLQDSLYGSIENKKWENYWACAEGLDLNLPNTPSTGLADAQGACYNTCEARYAGFVQSLIRMYHNDSIYVEGDVYELQRDTTWGQEYSFSSDSLASTPGTSYYVTMAEVECAARSLVAACQESCELTVFTTGSHVDSVGTQAEIAAMQKAMTWSYHLERASCSTSCECPSGGVKVGPASSTDTSIVKLWDRHYGGSDEDRLWDIVEVTKTGTGGYLLVGWTNSSNDNDITEAAKGDRDYWVIKVNDLGDKQWDKRFGGRNGDTLRSVIETSDGGFLLGGFSNSSSTGDKADSSRWSSIDYWAIKIDFNGDIEWEKTYGGSGSDRLQSVTETSDGYFLLGGYSNSDRGGEKSDNAYSSTNDYWLIKVDQDGQKIWDKRFGTTSDDKLMSVRETKDKKYMLAGYTDGGADNDKTQASRGGYDYWLIKVDTAGTKVAGWDYRFGGTENDYLFSMEPVQAEDDSSFIVSGVSKSTLIADQSDKSQNPYGTPYTFDYWTLKIDKAGTKTWDKTHGGTDSEGPETERHVDIKEASDGGFILGGSSKSSISGDKTQSAYNSSYDFWTLRLDSSGDKLWDKTWGGNDGDYFTAIDQDSEDTYWFAGYSYSGSSGNKTQQNHDNTLATSDFWVIRTKDKCSHDAICLSWVEPTTPPDSLWVYYNPISCDSMSSQIVMNAILLQVGQYIQNELDDFEAKYFATCASPDSIRDTLILTYPLGYHHYTLYYYDRAGNLVRTVAPKGFNDFLDGGGSNISRNQHPTYDYTTKYKYNSIKQLVEQYSPDGDTSMYWYDSKGQLRFSRNAKQKALSQYSYTKYDNLGRIIEVGESNKNYSSFTDSMDVTTFPVSSSWERNYTVYTTPGTNIYYKYDPGMPQRYLQNRISYSYNDDEVYTYYSYDPHGNVEWLVQELPGLGKSFIRYEYDLISGKVLQVHYNEGYADEFHHRYTYDEDQRIKKAETAWGPVSSLTAGVTSSRVGWDEDASYTYYKHGPLKRTEIGEDNIQGLDYVYTIQGWLKGINYPTLNSADDPGNDDNTTFSSDAFGMVLGYHSNDFNRTGSRYNPSTAGLVSSQSGITDLYNGNISNWTLQTDTISGNYAKQMGFTYKYDQLNRIKTENYRDYSSSTWNDPASSYDNSYTYDGNGNIKTLVRTGNTSAMDNLTYNYTASTNQLNYVDDVVNSTNYSTDVDDQSSGNYKYDAIGNLVEDVQEGIDTILWNVYGKIKKVVKTNDDSLVFTYDPLGNRISKRYYTATATEVTYYVLDAQGNVMSTYLRETSGSNYIYTQKEVPIYGSDRIGMKRPNVTAKTWPTSGSPFSCFSCNVNTFPINTENSNGYYSRTIAKKEYELKDHLGNVRATVLDQKYGDSTARVESYTNYYAFGSEMPGKTFTSANGYRFGFNGKEKDDELKGSGNSYDFGARMYDARLGRWLAVDPQSDKYPYASPYNFTLNNPVLFIDPDGEEVTIKDVASLKAVLGGLTSKEIKRIKVRKDGTLKVRGRREGSSNFENLRTLVKSKTNYNYLTSASYMSAAGPVSLPDNVAGRTISPKSESPGFPDTHVSPDNDVYIIVKPTTESGAVEVAAHEGYGHAYFGELKRQGEDVNPSHDYGIEELPNPKYDPGNPYNMEPPFIKQVEERNKELRTQIWGAVAKARANYAINSANDKWKKRLEKKVKKFEKNMKTP